MAEWEQHNGADAVDMSGDSILFRRERFETLHGRHVQALQAHRLTLAAVIATQINEDLSKHAFKRYAPAHVDEPRRIYPFIGSYPVVESIDLDFDVAKELLTLLDDPVLAPSAADMVTTVCDNRADCVTALKRLLRGPDAWHP